MLWAGRLRALRQVVSRDSQGGARHRVLARAASTNKRHSKADRAGQCRHLRVITGLVRANSPTRGQQRPGSETSSGGPCCLSSCRVCFTSPSVAARFRPSAGVPHAAAARWPRRRWKDRASFRRRPDADSIGWPVFPKGVHELSSEPWSAGCLTTRIAAECTRSSDTGTQVVRVPAGGP